MATARTRTRTLFARAMLADDPLRMFGSGEGGEKDERRTRRRNEGRAAALPRAVRPRDGEPQPLGMRTGPGACTGLTGPAHGHSCNRHHQAKRSERDSRMTIPSIWARPHPMRSLALPPAGCAASRALRIPAGSPAERAAVGRTQTAGLPPGRAPTGTRAQGGQPTTAAASNQADGRSKAAARGGLQTLRTHLPRQRVWGNHGQTRQHRRHSAGGVQGS